MLFVFVETADHWLCYSVGKQTMKNGKLSEIKKDVG